MIHHVEWIVGLRLIRLVFEVHFFVDYEVLDWDDSAGVIQQVPYGKVAPPDRKVVGKAG